MDLPSLREGLATIGFEPGAAFSLRDDLVSSPGSLRAVLRATLVPTNWRQVTDIKLADSQDQYWTDEVQGIAWDGANWIFCCNANQSKPGVNDKSLYVFRGGTKLHDGNWISSVRLIDVDHPYVDEQTWVSWWTKYQIVPPPPPYFKESWEHWGQLDFHDGRLYVAHFWTEGPLSGRKSVVVFRDDAGHLTLDSWIRIGEVQPSDGSGAFTPEFQAVNPWDGLIYTSHGSENPGEFYLHHPYGHPRAGEWTGRVLRFTGGKALLGRLEIPGGLVPLDLPSNVQGACFSPNGHLYVSCNARIADRYDHMAIGVFSALNGHFLGVIPVLAKEGKQEMEGVCYANVNAGGGHTTQIHGVLLENETAAIDDIYVKGFSADPAELI